MTWENVIQLITGLFAGIGGWFLYDLVKEFKSFKSETKSDVVSLKAERRDFQHTVRNAEMTIAIRVADMHKLHSDFNVKVQDQLSSLKTELAEIKELTTHAKFNSKNYGEFLKKALELCGQLNLRLKAQEKELTSVQIKINDLILVKGASKESSGQ